jgi:hypothetical protein
VQSFVKLVLIVVIDLLVHKLFAWGCLQHVFLYCFQCAFLYYSIATPKIISFLCVSGFCRIALIAAIDLLLVGVPIV